MKNRLEKFILRIPFTDCWIWNGNRSTDGYGRISVDSFQSQAHRVSYETYVGPIPNGMYVLHRCDTPSCVNPNHLFLGTTQENTQDKINKGRQLRGEKIGNSVLTDAQAKEIKYSKIPNYILAEQYGCSRTTVSLIKNGHTWKHL